MIEAGSVSFGSTGPQTLSLNRITGTPKGVIFFSTGLFGVNETANARNGMGMADGTYQWASAQLKNSSGSFSRSYPGSDAFVALSGTTGAPATRGNVTGFSAGAINVNLTNADPNFQIGFVAFD